MADSSYDRGGKTKLLQYHQRHPGKLARQMLELMEKEVRDESDIAERRSKRKMPVVGKAFHRVLLRSHPYMGKRNQQELLTLLTTLDHLAGGRWQKAADIIAQRVKALEKHMQDDPTFAQARFLELVDADSTSLVSPDECELMMRNRKREMALATYVRPDPRPWGGSKGWKDWGKGKGQQKSWKGDIWEDPTQVAEKGAAPVENPFEASQSYGKSKGKDKGKKGKGKGKWWN